MLKNLSSTSVSRKGSFLDEEQKNEEDGFKYLLATQKEFCVISFVGPINNKAKEELGKCLDEIKNTESCLFILNFRDVTGIDKAIPVTLRFPKKVGQLN